MVACVSETDRREGTLPMLEAEPFDAIEEGLEDKPSSEDSDGGRSLSKEDRWAKSTDSSGASGGGEEAIVVIATDVAYGVDRGRRNEVYS
jgi:hypothetical protein